ncbi:hypothetical protein Mhar_0686 [Methanothrix harundinacea 6Ac]|uniref:Uncharacterized protein n=1 Tax=Methanothrix harundinacea (strain 6Ac) TaxID=1110509 RepID=G7WK71_METH6|nr:hypothetical protein Mhar_0686 [Methanothrix harundinacea 6Ac]
MVAGEGPILPISLLFSVSLRHLRAGQAGGMGVPDGDNISFSPQVPPPGSNFSIRRRTDILMERPRLIIVKVRDGGT